MPRRVGRWRSVEHGAARYRPPVAGTVEQVTAALAQTPFGTAQGLDRDGVAVFKGIPYATARRFQHPTVVRSWDGTLDAGTYRPQCPQIPSTLDRLLGGSRLPFDEACLHLNVFTPACDGARRPVLVWIHGGAFVTGGGAMPWYDGSSLARRGDVVVVTLNYRLGALGFAGDLNTGLADQIAALTWVAEAISAFGGDPDNVTVFGESAGGASVVSLLAVPAATTLFQRAWAMSPSIPQLRDPLRARRAMDELLDAAGVSTLDELAAAPLEQVLDAQRRLLADPAGALTAFAPTPDGSFVPGDIVTAAAADPRPLVVGTTRDEMHLFTAFDPRRAQLDGEGLRRAFARCFDGRAEHAIAGYREYRPDHAPGQLVSAMQTDETFRVPARRLADDRVRRGLPTWTYWFTFPTPAFGGVLGACHGLDIPYAFHNLHRPGVETFTGDAAEREHVADAFAGALLRFASTGDPGWPAFDAIRRPTRRLDLDGDVLDDPEAELLALWGVPA
jgi:para-nitrobenzyl esterase